MLIECFCTSDIIFAKDNNQPISGYVHTYTRGDTDPYHEGSTLLGSEANCPRQILWIKWDLQPLVLHNFQINWNNWYFRSPLQQECVLCGRIPLQRVVISQICYWCYKCPILSYTKIASVKGTSCAGGVFQAGTLIQSLCLFHLRSIVGKGGIKRTIYHGLYQYLDPKHIFNMKKLGLSCSRRDSSLNVR